MLDVKSNFSVRQAVIRVVVSTLPILLIFLFLFSSRHARLPTAAIEGIVVQAPCFIPVSWIAEVLELCADEPLQMCQLDLEIAKQRLLATQLLEKVSLRLCKPNLLHLRAVPRVPLVEIADFPGTALDSSGVLFPLAPLYVNTVLPKIYLGLQCPENPWGCRIDTSLVEAIALLVSRAEISHLDLSEIRAPTLGQRVCIMGLKNGDILKCFPENAIQQLAFYGTLPLDQFEKPLFIDLRLNQAAFVYPRAFDKKYE
ncbi:MAG: hypothetical protein JSS62_03665 [Verrucomicrobia bacterium]|nr:hypothetical protein [Verrucomicrobiota bacterium]MBS0645096.1 hypothetical protein [Verrucomicrobiota bacterium]